MRKTLNENKLRGQSAGRTLLAFSLAASLAAFGCTTNRTPGNGEPLGAAPTGPAATTGSSSGNTTPSNPPMMSSSQHLDPLPVTTTRAKRLPLSPDEAAAVLAGNQLNRGVRILGPSNPGSSGRAYASDNVATGAYQDPILRLGGIVTVNSSVNSIAHVPALASDGGGAVVSGTTSAATITGTTAAATTTGTTSTALGAVTANAGTIATPATAALPVTAGAVSTTGTGLLTPTVSSAAVITPTPASSGLVSGPTTGTTRTVTAASTTNGTARTAAATTTGTTVTAASTSRTATATVAPIRISQDASGRVVVSNSSGKSQR